MKFTIATHLLLVLLSDAASEFVNAGSARRAKSSKCHPHLQDGFTCGMATESVGVFAGDEKYYVDGVKYDYCSLGTWNPASGQNILVWNGGYLGEGDTRMSCVDVGVDALSKTVNGAWLPTMFPSEQYILNIEQVRCLPAADCDFDILASGEFPGYTVTARSCNAHLKKDMFREGMYSCELTQVNLLDDGAGHKELVTVQSYVGYTGGYNNYTCPAKPAYGMEAAMNDPHMDGNARFVLQVNDLTEASYNASKWTCPSVL